MAAGAPVCTVPPSRLLPIHADPLALPRAFAPELPPVLFRTGPFAHRHLAAAGGDVMAYLSSFRLGAAAWRGHVLSIHRGAAAGAGGRSAGRSGRSPAGAVDY